MAIASTSEVSILALVFNATVWTGWVATIGATTTIGVALHTADPGTGGTQNTSEAAYAGYTRTSTNRSTAVGPPPGWTAPTGANPASTSPTGNITFTASTAAGATITNFSTGGPFAASPATTAILWSGTVTPNIAIGGSGITPSLTTATTITLT